MLDIINSATNRPTFQNSLIGVTAGYMVLESGLAKINPLALGAGAATGRLVSAFALSLFAKFLPSFGNAHADLRIVVAEAIGFTAGTAVYLSVAKCTWSVGLLINASIIAGAYLTHVASSKAAHRC